MRHEPERGGLESSEDDLSGQPGFVRMDSMHQGDLDGRKDVYADNAFA